MAFHVKPKNPVLNRQHHLSQKMVFAWLCNNVNNDAGTIFVPDLFGNFLRTTGHDQGNLISGVRGLRWQNTGTSASASFASNAATWMPTENITIVCGYRKQDTTNRTNPFFTSSVALSSSQTVHIFLPWTDNNIYWGFGGNTAGTNRMVSAWTSDTDEHIWAFTSAAGSNGMSIWQDGDLFDQDLTAGDSRNQYGSGAEFQFGQGDLAELDFLYIYDRVLTNKELVELTHPHANPFVMFNDTPFRGDIPLSGMFCTDGIKLFLSNTLTNAGDETSGYVGLALSGTTAGSPDVIHTSIDSSNVFDEMFVFVTNTHTNTLSVTFQIAENDGSNDVELTTISVPPKAGLKCVIPGLVLSGGYRLEAYAPTNPTNINIFGFVNRISQQ